MGVADIKVNKSFWKIFANKNFRGLPVADLYCELEYKHEQLRERVEKFNEAQARNKLIGQRLTDDTEIYYTTCCISAILKEIKKRTVSNKEGIVTTNKEIIQVIRDKTRIEDVLEWYCEVFYHQKNWTFRCALHEDRHPSGKIYQDQNTYHCFQCNQNGDVFDAVMTYGRTDFMSAVRKLATNIGLELKEAPKLKGNEVVG